MAPNPSNPGFPFFSKGARQNLKWKAWVEANILNCSLNGGILSGHSMFNLAGLHIPLIVYNLIA